MEAAVPSNVSRCGGSAPAPFSAVPAASWKLTRHCCVTPRTFLGNVGAFAVTMSLLGTGFWMAGFPLILLFCLCQAAVFAAAALVYALHATDGEQVLLDGANVRVETACGARQQVIDFPAHWVRLHCSSSGALTLRSGTSEVSLGAQVTAATRRVFAEEFAASLAAVRGVGGPVRAASRGNA